MSLLTGLTLAVVLLIVLVLVYYLIRIILALRRAGDHLEALVSGLEAVREHTRPLPDYLNMINHAMTQLHAGLGEIDANLLRIARVLRR